jgi:hypothetical protein
MNRRRWNILVLAIVGFVFIIVVSILGAINKDDTQVYTLVLYAGLVVVTMLYAYFTMEVANATRNQADASIRMAEEMRAQTVMGSRPITIPRPVHAPNLSDIYKGQPNEWFQFFEVYNAGNGPAVNLEVAMLNEKKAMQELQLQPFLRAGEHITFTPSNLSGYTGSNCYVLCRYQSVLSKAEPQVWYETWLSFKPTKSQTADKVYVASNELKFQEVSEKVSY